MKRERLTREEVNERLKDVAGWTIADGKLTRRFEFKNFAESLGFVNKVGALAEAADHHPDIKFGWGYAEFEITTHDRGGLTDFDFALAREIDRI
ncbi:MAG TPA: 4a-hydroxytetrahydrobiopterin dehydratase [Pyrinomonadaceae bacterium]|nr:4a-hydroxytetrahydrobiopterin dehydratase [Pyrinomonadaceae bacterium]